MPKIHIIANNCHISVAYLMYFRHRSHVAAQKHQLWCHFRPISAVNKKAGCWSIGKILDSGAAIRTPLYRLRWNFSFISTYHRPRWMQNRHNYDQILNSIGILYPPPWPIRCLRVDQWSMLMHWISPRLFYCKFIFPQGTKTLNWS